VIFFALHFSGAVLFIGKAQNMAKLTKKQRNEIQSAIDYLTRGLSFLRSERIAVCRRKTVATTTLDYVNSQSQAVLYEIDTHIGSEICCFDHALTGLSRLLEAENLHPVEG